MRGFDTCYLTHFDVFRYEREDRTINHILLGSPKNYLAVMLSGYARFRTGGSCIEIRPGELLYLPQSCIYTSEWYCEPTCEFYSVGFIFSVFGENARFLPQKLPDSDGRMLEAVNSIWYNSEEHKPLALSAFYELYDVLLTRLAERSQYRTRVSITPALECMEQHTAGGFDIPYLARLCHMSESAFYAAFREQTGFTPVEYKNLLRCRTAVNLLCTTDHTVETIAGMVGCSTAEYLRRLLMKTTGKTPKQIRAEKLTI
ncbi:MAG: helix-turn-helix transcriptional regulator [Clostridia bacterium]|nr:helix-turn-helix transcriptional regulator [Clostridia bacterium]